VTNCTISQNTGQGGAVFQNSGGAGRVNLKNSIVSGNPGGDVSGITDNGNNLAGAGPLLAPLGNYGGPTQTMALLPGSPAINAGANTGAPATDQRGISRDGAVDIGAFESRGFTIAVTSGSPQSTLILSAFGSPLAASVSSAFSEPVTGGTVTFSAPSSGASCTFPGNVTITTRTIDASGMATSPTLTANGTAGGPYDVAASTATGLPAASFALTNSKGNQTITFGAPEPRTFGDADFAVSASASSALAVSFNASGQCTVAGTLVHVTGAGSCTITASQSGDTNFAAAIDVPQGFAIGKSNQTITFDVLADQVVGNADFSVSAVATSGLTVSFSASGQCTVAGTAVHLTGAGSCTINASQGGDVNNNAATNVPRSFAIGKSAQTINFGSLANKTFDDDDFLASATATSGLTVGFAATGNCTVTGSAVHISGVGSCTITAAQVGDGNYHAAPNVLQSFTIARSNQTISFAALGNKTLGDADFAIGGTSDSGLGLSFAGSGQCTVSGSMVHIMSAGSCMVTASQAGDTNFNAASDVQQIFTIGSGTTALVTLSQSNYSVNEETGFLTITVNRGGDISVPVTVDYATDDTGSTTACSALNRGMASARCDFGLTSGTLTFAATEMQKSFIIPITQDSYTEGPEMFTISLSNVTGAGASFAAPSNATVTINDSTATVPNTNDETDAFVRQQYRDFLNREADPAGLAFWKDNIDKCNDDARRPAGLDLPQCLEVMRINTSAAFFFSIEFQTTGNLVRSFYVAALNRPSTNNMPAFTELERDTQAMQRGVIVEIDNSAWQTVLNHNRDAFMSDFVTRAEFVGLYPAIDTPAQYVDKLYLHAAVTPETPEERQAAIDEFSGAGTAADPGARGRALLRVTQNASFLQREMNRSLVQMEYFGYLRRNPNDAPDANFVGYDFWVTKLNESNGNFVSAEMVRAFIVSAEYRRRFGL